MALELDADERRILLGVAEDAIAHALATGEARVPNGRELASPRLQIPTATFVTLERDDRTLGCMGTRETRLPLAESVAHFAVAAAFADPNRPSITAHDFVAMTITVSVLSSTERLRARSAADLAARLRPGVDGLVLEAARGVTVLLPWVWSVCPTVDEFLGTLWRKAGLRPGDWPRGTRVLRCTADEFASPGPRSLAALVRARATRAPR